MLLFCIPHAGSSALNYFKWSKYLPSTIKIVPLELAGRGNKLESDFYKTFDEAVEDLCNDLSKKMTGEEYALYGHSLGCTLIYEMYYKIKEKGLKLPCHLFFSGRFSPLTVRTPDFIVDEVDDETFLESVKSIGGLTDELLNNPELLAKYIEIFKADFRIIEGYQYKERELIDCDVTVLSGDKDYSISNKELMLWNRLTSQNCTICKIKGGHFFPFDNTEDTIAVVKEKLEVY